MECSYKSGYIKYIHKKGKVKENLGMIIFVDKLKRFKYNYENV